MKWGLIPLEKFLRSGLLRIDFVQCISKNVWLSWQFLCSPHIKTSFSTRYFWWDWQWRISSLFYFPSLCLPWFCLALGYKYAIHKSLFLIKVKQSFVVIIAKSWHVKYWINIELFESFAGTWLTLLHMWHISWLLEFWQCDLYCLC